MISDSNKQVDPRSDPKAETHIVDRIRKLSVRTILFEPAFIGVIGQDLITNFQDNFIVELSLKSLSPLNMITSKAVVIVLACKSAEVNRNTLKICTPPDRTIRNHNRISTAGVNGYFSVQAVVTILVSPNGRGTLIHRTLPLTDLQPKKGNRISRALKKWV